MSSIEATKIAQEWIGDLYSDEEERRDLAILIDKKIKPLIGEARISADVCIPGYSMAIKLDEILKGWEDQWDPDSLP